MRILSPGDWFEDKMEGVGTYVWASGEVYKGEYKANARHGKGKMTYSDGTIYEGVWEADKKVLVSTSFDG
jgi:hypothetical protein